MKVIFIEDVPDVALAGETREVADGYGRNYLLPKKLAVLANSAASNVVEAQLKKVVVKRVQAEAEMAEVAGKLNGVEITLKAKVGEKERLYGSITGADIADELSNITGLVVDKRKIELEEPIRQLGSYEITVRFTHDITAAINVTVESDKVAEEKPEKEEKKEKKPRAKKKVKEAEAKIEETEAGVEEAEVATAVEEETAKAAEVKKAKKPRARKAKKAEEAEAPVVEPEARAEESEKKETESGE